MNRDKGLLPPIYNSLVSLAAGLKPCRLHADKLVYSSITLRSPYQNIHKNSNYIHTLFTLISPSGHYVTI